MIDFAAFKRDFGWKYKAHDMALERRQSASGLRIEAQKGLLNPMRDLRRPFVFILLCRSVDQSRILPPSLFRLLQRGVDNFFKAFLA